MSDKIEIGNRIRIRREQLGLTQQELGDALGMNKSTIGRYEKGQISTIKCPILQSIAYALNVDPNWLALKSDKMIKEAAPADDGKSDALKNIIVKIRKLSDEDLVRLDDYIDLLLTKSGLKE